MCDCELTIITKNEDEISSFRSQGVMAREKDGERVRYSIEGDEGELFFSDTFFTNLRRGSCGMEASFKEGEESEILLKSSSLTGRIPVRTKSYRLEKNEGKRKIELRYDLLGSKTIQTFLLEIKIEFFSEEK